MRRSLTLTTLACALVLACVAPAAQAWSVNTRIWLAPTISYNATSPAGWRAATYAARAWRGAGARFVPVSRGADVSVRVGGRCGGEASVGRRRPAFVRIGRCSPASQALLAVHEFGHVLGLSHEDRYCSRMNSVVLRDGTPARCARASAAHWLRHPLTRDDVAGAHWIERQARRLRRHAAR